MISEIVFWLMVAALVIIVLYGLWHEALRQYRIEDLPPLENSRRPK